MNRFTALAASVLLASSAALPALAADEAPLNVTRSTQTAEGAAAAGAGGGAAVGGAVAAGGLGGLAIGTAVFIGVVAAGGSDGDTSTVTTTSD